jgi:hypothetical protein
MKKKNLKAKEELWKLKYFTMQKKKKKKSSKYSSKTNQNPSTRVPGAKQKTVS